MDELPVGPARIRLVRGDITDQRVDAVVNAANPTLMGGGGVDGAIHRKGGPSILDACRSIRSERYPDGLPTGEAVVTGGGNLEARFVVHTVGPVYGGGSSGARALLASAYRSALREARSVGARTVAFPSISTGAYGYPVEEAAEEALATVARVLGDYPDAFDEVRFVLFSESDLEAYRAVLHRSV
jgi:O-acetyl-ADP-ribose deacetylase